MSLLPSDQATLRVDATPAVVAARLDELITSRRPIVFAPTAPFVGWVRDSRFEIKRARSWLAGQGGDPLLRGVIVSAGFGSEIRLSLQLDRLSTVSLSAWYAILVVGVGLLFGMALRAADSLPVGAAAGAVFLLPGALLLFLARRATARWFKAETAWALQRLREGLRATADADVSGTGTR